MKPQGITDSQWVRFNLFFVMEHVLGYKAFEKIAGKLRASLYKDIDAKLNNSGRGKLLPFTEVYGDMSHEELKEKYLSNVDIPVVFRSAAANWKCVRKWGFDYFKKKYGGNQISLNDNIGLTDRKSPKGYESMSFSDYIDDLKNGSQKYLRFSRILDEDPILKDDFDLTWLQKFHLPGAFGAQFLMFMGNKESITPIHTGFGNTIYIQVTGKKKWIMWAPNERIFFDPRAERRAYNFTHADPHQLGDSRYPLFKYARRYEVILKPGDVLWFPPHLWHQVENMESGVGVSYNFNHLPTSFKASKVLSCLFFLATRPYLFIDIFYHRFKKRDYIFTRTQDELK